MAARRASTARKGRLLRHPRTDLVALDKNAAHGFAATHALVCYPTDTVYSFIPKNGCSTLRLSLAIANGCAAGPEDWPWIHPNNGTFRASLRDLVTAQFTFVVLRCPFRRLASVFLDKILSHTPEFWQLFRMERDALDHDALSFRGFVELLDQPDRLSANIHWRPQSDFLIYDTYDAYLTLENFAEGIARIERDGFAVHDARALTRHGTDQYSAEAEGPFADTPIITLRAMQREGRLPGYATLYDADLIAAVRSLYADDIRLYADHADPAGLLFPDQYQDLKGTFNDQT
ncbi:sulfotransferase family 2 domain-containing protein [Aestuariivita sp.]|jgi:hypothetical protein|uniref:sulfotransferase family 2 domain-containing protein n=1 Tax=Aestuariivita sp. TaxID=1872407 RepID=UPI00216D2952|nr:sulfotransferase family 2 domain-containing protein [Aestuariivita sp.]MCE8009740.1 sulfotransferase family protein [Aestuariivita sp.]